MGFLFDEKSMINDNVLLHSERMESKYTRFLERNPTFVTYYNIDTINTTVDSGLLNIERILGKTSPVRFNEISDFPLYGIDQIVIQLNDEIEGITGSYDGEAIVIPNTINPLPNDMFVINALERDYVFMVTNVIPDTIKSNNFIKIEFTLKGNEEGYSDNLKNQTLDKYDCLFAQIGTDEQAIVRSEDRVALLGLEKSYKKISDHYKELFYSSKYNSFIYEQEDLSRIYDRYLNYFINEHSLFNERNNYETLYILIEDTRARFYQMYDQSLYRAIEERDIEVYTSGRFTLFPIGSPKSIFNYYRDLGTRTVELGIQGTTPYVRDEDMAQLTNLDVLPTDIMLKYIHKHLHDNIKSIPDLVDQTLGNYHRWMKYDWQTYLYVPIMLYVIRYHYNNFMKQ